MKNTLKRTIKKYPNRRLYDTTTSCYITLEEVKQLILDNIEIEVIEAKTNEDITLTTLLQIVMEAESIGKPFFTYNALTQIIRFYGRGMQSMMGEAVEKNLAVLTQMQQHLLDQSKTLVGKNLSTNPSVWGELVSSQASAMQAMMNQYAEQNTDLFTHMQQQWHAQAQQVLKSFPNRFVAPSSATKENSTASSRSSTKKSKTE